MTTIAATKILVTDLDAMSAFYTKSFGFVVLRRMEDTRPSGEIIAEDFLATSADGACNFLLLERPKDMPVATGEAVIVITVEDLEGTVKRLLANGGTLDQAPTSFEVEGHSVHMAIARDIEGHLLELVQPG